MFTSCTMRAVWAWALACALLLIAGLCGAQTNCNSLVTSGIFLNPPFTTSGYTRPNVHAALCAIAAGYSISAYQGAATGSTAAYFNTCPCSRAPSRQARHRLAGRLRVL